MEKYNFFDIVKEDNWRLVGLSTNQHVTKESLDALLKSLPESKTKNNIISKEVQELKLVGNKNPKDKNIFKTK